MFVANQSRNKVTVPQEQINDTAIVIKLALKAALRRGGLSEADALFRGQL